MNMNICNFSCHKPYWLVQSLWMTYRPTWSSPQDARLFDVQWSGAVTLQISIMAWRVTAGAVMWSIDSAAASDRQFCDDQYFSADQLTRRCDHQRLSMALQCVIDEWDVIPHHSLDDDVQMRCILHTTSSVLILLSLSWLNSLSTTITTSFIVRFTISNIQHIYLHHFSPRVICSAYCCC